MKVKWYRVEYMTTLKPPRVYKMDDRYFPKGNGKPFKIKELAVFKANPNR